MSWFERLRGGLSKTRQQLGDTSGSLGQDLRDIFANNADTIEDLEYALISADVGRAAAFLASPLAAYITGAELLVHGGGEKPAFLAASTAANKH